jgi:hypothetical protein
MTPGVTTGNWQPVWDGYGKITRVTDGVPAVDLQPGVAATPSDTHSSLVASTARFGDTDLTMSYRTVQQLRQGSAPNPWEVGWVVWHYTDSSHFYDVLLKPTGWELAKEDPAYPGNQRFLATGSTPFAVGVAHTVHVTQVGNSITVVADGVQLTSFVDNERPYLSGALGLYCEDSQVNFTSVSATGRI